jgi:hypothetical protein
VDTTSHHFSGSGLTSENFTKAGYNFSSPNCAKGRAEVPSRPSIRPASLLTFKRSWKASRATRLAPASGLMLWLLPLLHPLLLLCVALLHLLGLLLMALFRLLPSCFIRILLGEVLVILLLSLLELLMLLFLFRVKLLLLLPVFLVQLRIARVRRSRPVVRSNFTCVIEGRTVGISSRVWRAIGIVIVAGMPSVVIDAAIRRRLPASAGFLGGNDGRATK